MKKISYIFLLLSLTGVWLGGCAEDDNETASNLHIAKSDSFFIAKGGAGKITVENVHGQLTADSREAWCRITGIDGNTVSFEVDKYKQLSSRTTEIILSDGVSSQVLAVTQQGVLFLLGDQTHFKFDFNGGSQLMPYEINNTDLVARVESVEPQDWIVTVHEQNGLKIIAAPNLGGYREARLIISIYDGDELIAENVARLDIEQGTWMTARDIPGTWDFSYTHYPGLNELPFALQFSKPELLEEVSRQTIPVEFTADASDLYTITTVVDGYRLTLEIDPTTSRLRIHGLQKYIGNYSYNGVNFYPILGLLSLADDVEVLDSKKMADHYYWNVDSWLQGAADSQEVPGGVMITYRFTGGGFWPNATGFNLSAATAENVEVNPFAVLMGRNIRPYNNITFSRVFPR